MATHGVPELGAVLLAMATAIRNDSAQEGAHEDAQNLGVNRERVQGEAQRVVGIWEDIRNDGMANAIDGKVHWWTYPSFGFVALAGLSETLSRSPEESFTTSRL